MKSELVRFIHDALSSGRSRTDIAQVLRDAGWSNGEIRKGLERYADLPFPVPVPMPVSTFAAKDMFRFLIQFVFLYWLFYLTIDLVFDMIDLYLRQSDRYTNSIMTSIRSNLAGMIVSLPVFLFSFIWNRRAMQVDASLRRSGARRWLTYATLVLVIVGVAISLSSLIRAALERGVTLSFALKVVTVLGLSSVAIAYFLNEIKKEELS